MVASLEKVLITGVAGFIGSNLADCLLREGYEVVGIDNLSYGFEEQVPSDIDFHKLDIRSKEIYPIFKGIDFVFHFAAKNSISDCQDDPVETADINVTGSVNVFEAAKRAKVKKVIYAETSALYEGSKIMPTPESEEHPESYYAVSKSAERLFAESYRRWFGTKMTALRYFNVYGPRQDYRRTIPPVICAFIIKLLKGEQPTIYGAGTKKRDFVYVDDVNKFHLLTLKNPITDNQVYNLGSGVNYPISELYAIIAKLLDSDIQPNFEDDLPGEAEENLADITSALALNWKPEFTIEDGLKESIKYIREYVI